MNNFDFTGKIGPLPVWAWGLIFGGIAVGYYYWSQLKDQNGQTVTEDNSAAADNATGVTSMSGADLIDSAYTATGLSASTLATTSAPESTDTNSAWGIRAVQALIGKGIAPITAQTAVQKYLDGQALDSSETALVNQAIVLVGSTPPDGTATPTSGGSDVAKWQWLQDGTVIGVMPDGSKVTKTIRDYIDAGMPGWSYNAYQWKYHKAASNTTTVASIATRYGTTPDVIMALNNWKSAPNLKRGQKVKVPDSKVK